MTRNRLYPIEGLGQQLRTARRNARIKQEDVAAHMNMARTTIVAIEQNQRGISQQELTDFSALYGVAIERLESDSPLPFIGKLNRREQRLILAWRNQDYETLMLMVGMAIRRKREGERDEIGMERETL